MLLLDFSWKSQAAASKLLVTEDHEDRLLNSLKHLEKQGHMSRYSFPDGGKLWARALESVSDKHLRFALNSAIDTLPHNADLALWKKLGKYNCPLYSEKQTLTHIFNCCKVAREVGDMMAAMMPSSLRSSCQFQIT